MDLKKLKAKRGGYVLKLDNFEQFMNNFDIDKNSKFDLIVRINKVDECYNNYNTVYDTIVQLVEEDELININENFLNFETKYFKVKAKIENVLDQYKEKELGIVKNVQDQKIKSNVQIRLPELKLPHFDGALDMWLKFKNTFEEVIVKNESLSDVERLHYLKSYVHGDANRTLDAVQYSSHGFEIAWKALVSRYDNPRSIIEKHISCLFNIKPLVHESSRDLRKILDDCSIQLNAIEKLGQNIDSWDMIIIHIISNVLDKESRKQWENEIPFSALPTWQQMSQFIDKRCRILESIEHTRSTNCARVQFPKPKLNSNFNHPQKTFVTGNSQNKSEEGRCFMCNDHHLIGSCSLFLKLSPIQRYYKIKELNLCINCLRPNHRVVDCNAGDCRICKKKHNSLLHMDSYKNKFQNSKPINGITSSTNMNQDIKVAPSQSNPNPVNGNHNTITESNLYCARAEQKTVLLSTAMVLICTNKGKFIPCRTLLDTCSESNFISSNLANKLGIKREYIESISISGLNHNETTINQKCTTTIKSRLNNYSRNLDFLIVQKIANRYPAQQINVSRWLIPEKVKLADPTFNVPGSVDLLIGAELFYEVIKHKRFKLSDDLPFLQESHFGWIVSGKLQETPNFFLSNHYSENDCIENYIDKQIEKLWETDTYDNDKALSLEEKHCEDHFEKTYSRNNDGRFVVRLPLKDSVVNLGRSKHLALKRFQYLENRFNRDEQLKTEYIKFMTEYEHLGHMTLSNDSVGSNHTNLEYFLPHHAVLKPTSTTTKLRTVFDGSAKTDSLISLNDVLMVGPVVQDELWSIMLRFRQYLYGFTTDVEKMYRQIAIHDDDTKYQKILWRSDPSQPVHIFELRTVTYGTSAAPYLATKVLKKLAELEKETYPLASEVAQKDFYIDDLLTGSNDLNQALELQKQLIGMFRSSGMHLRKWASNNSKIVESIPQQDREQSLNDYNETIKTLGLLWSPSSDNFLFEFKKTIQSPTITKRTVLSEISKFFDPLGLIAPIIVTAKIIMQKIWLLKVGWDDDLPKDLQSLWISFRDNLGSINNLSVNRCIIPKNTKHIEIHGFADASTIAYGASIYIRCIDSQDKITVNLLCSRSRIAPLKTLTIPRLELNAALLLARLVGKVKRSMTIDFDKFYLWSDSSITLSWIKLPPYQLKLYVGNRVSEIQELTSEMTWRHVDTKSNASDILSRGILPQDLASLDMWWFGPLYLKKEEGSWPDKFMKPSNIKIPELKDQILSLKLTSKKFVDFVDIEKYSTFSKLIRVVAYVLRFIKNRILDRQGINRNFGELSTEELAQSVKCVIRLVQHKEFRDEILHLKAHRELPRNSKILSLSPFLDTDNLLRVGGRLKNSDLPFDYKHQYLLPKHHFTMLLIKDEHLKNLHGGVQTTLAAIRQKYWPINGKNLVKFVLHRCISCFRANPKCMEQYMGDLPKNRLEICRPFSKVGIDYCGPFQIKYRNQRNSATFKVYICIFVCFITKAVHIDMVEDATSDAFIACLKRFFARRGKSAHIMSDNGTNFVGALNELNKLFVLFQSQQGNDILRFCASQEIVWKFIPPRSPHFGGLWESTVKSFKIHLKRVTQNHTLTFTQLNTLMVEIEGIMNSRPLTALSSDPSDPQPLTPAHFLTGGPINSIFEPSLTHLQENRLSYWQKVTVMIQHFWNRFSKDYFHTLQQRKKWMVVHKNIEKDDLVLIHDDHVPPTHWMLGRVMDVVYGGDGKVRIATLKTKNGMFTRGIAKLAKLPISN